MSAATAEILNLYLDDDRRTLVVHEVLEGKRVTRRVRAEYVTFHKNEDFSAEMKQQLRELSIVRGMRVDGPWLRITWSDDAARRDGRRGMRENGIETFEGDVDPALLYLVESGAPIARPRRCYLDIEADSHVPLSRKEDMRILSWALVDAETGAVESAVLDEDTDSAERSLLRRLAKALRRFDQICVWEGDWAGGEFDSVVVPARWRARGVEVDERDWIWTNQLAVWKRHSSAESGAEGSFKLDVIAHEQLGEGKESVPASVVERFGAEMCRHGLGRITRELYDAGGQFRALLVSYNEHDAVLLHRLEQEMRFVELATALASVCGLVPEDRSMDPTRLMDGYMLRLGRKVGRRFPTRERFEKGEDEERKKFKGAVVFPPRSVPNKKPKEGEELWTEEDARAWRREHGFANGILHDIHVCDFSGMYPSIMRTFNLGLEAVVGWAKDPRELRPGQCMSPGTGLVTVTDPKALITYAFAELAAKRKEWQDKAASLPPGTPEWIVAMAMSNAFKVAMNSFYGAGGTPFSRFYNRDVSEATTQNAVHFLKLAAKHAQDRRMVLVYGDSVTGDRTVVVKDHRNLVQILPIERLWEVFTSDLDLREGKEVVMAPLGWRALTERGWMPLRQVIKHRVAKAIHEITTKHGQTAVTRDHSIIAGGAEVTPSDFVENGRAFTSVDAPREKPIATIDILDFVGEHAFEVERRGRRYVRRFVADPADREWVILEGGIRGEAGRFRRFYREGTSERAALMRLVGAYVSDGSATVLGLTTKTRAMLSFCKQDLGVQERVLADLRAISDLHYTGPMWTETVFVVRSGTMTAACFFAALCGWKSAGKCLPSFCYHATDADYAQLRLALAEGDGHVETSGAFVYTTISQELAAGVSYILSQHGERHSFSFRESKRAWKIRTRRGQERTRRYSIKHGVDVDFEGDVYDLSVDGAHTFVDGIGRVLLHNTDSTFIHGPTMDGFARYVRWLNDARFPEEVKRHAAVENHIKIAYEKSYDRVVFVTKKRYVARYLHYKFSTTCHCDVEKRGKVNPGSVDVRTMTCRDCGFVHKTMPRFRGKPEIKGLAFKRGDVYPLARVLQARIIDLLVGGMRVRDVEGREVPANPGIETPTEDIAIYRRLLEEFRDKCLAGKLSLDDVVLGKGLSKSLRDFAKDAGDAHVRVARVLQERGQKVSRGMRIEYVVVDASVSPQLVIPAEDFAGECDRYHLWAGTWDPSRDLLEAAFPDEPWSEWDAARPKKARKGRKQPGGEAQLGLALAPPPTRESSTAGADELAVPVYRSRPIRVEVPEEAGVDAVDRVREALGRFPGARAVSIVIRLKSGQEALVASDVRVSPGPRLREAVDAAITGDGD